LIGAGVLVLAVLIAPHVGAVRTAATPTPAATTPPVPDTWTLWQVWETGINIDASTAEHQSRVPWERGLTRDTCEHLKDKKVEAARIDMARYPADSQSTNEDSITQVWIRRGASVKSFKCLRGAEEPQFLFKGKG
jgi:hypothetical protein